MRDRVVRSIRKILPRNTFARGVSVLVSGTASAQVLGAVGAMVLTRLYTPEDFGILAVYTSLLSVISVVVTLQYQLAIPLPESNEVAANVSCLSLLAVAAISSLCALAVALFSHSIASLLNVPALASYLWVLPIGVFVSGAYQVFYYWALRIKDFGTIAVTRVKQSASMLFIQIVGSHFGPIALLAGQVANQSAGSFSLIKPAINRTEFRTVSRRGMATAAGRYKHFPLFSLWSSLFNSAGVALPPLLFAMFFTAGAAGLYALANRVLALPMTLVGAAIGNVFLANAVEAYRAGKLGALVEKVYSKLAQIAMPPTFILILAGPTLFSLVFGSHWLQAGIFAQWMAPWLFFVFVASPLSALLAVMEKQKQGLVFQVILLAVRILAIIVGSWLNSLVLAIALFSISSALCWVGFLVWITMASRNSLFSLFYCLARPMLQSLPIVGPLVIGVAFHLPLLPLVILFSVTGFMMAWYYMKLAKGLYQ